MLANGGGTFGVLTKPPIKNSENLRERGKDLRRGVFSAKKSNALNFVCGAQQSREKAWSTFLLFRGGGTLKGFSL